MQASGTQPMSDRSASDAGCVKLLALDVPVLKPGEAGDLRVALLSDVLKLTNRSDERRFSRNCWIFMRIWENRRRWGCCTKVAGRRPLSFMRERAGV
jgi:hypothetical protein